MSTTSDTALSRVAAAAALRSGAALWKALEAAFASGTSREEVEAAIEAAALMSADAVRREATRTLREVLARHGARERWGMPSP